MALKLPRRNFPVQSATRWPARKLLQAPFGLDTLHPVGEIPLGALRVCKNADLNEKGAATRRLGRSALGVALPAAARGLSELVRNNGTEYLLAVAGGRLYVSTDDWATSTQVPIRLYRPYPAFADDGTTGENLAGLPLEPAEDAGGAPGANIVAATSYDYAILAVYGGGKTTLSDVATHVAANPAQEIQINFHASYKAATYEVWRRLTTGPGTWGRLATGVTHATTGGKTLVQWTDDGGTAPDTSVVPSGSNTTEFVLSATADVDFEVDLLSADNAAYFVDGEGYMWTDGTDAGFVQPTSPATYLEEATGINALGDVTWEGHSATGLIKHHAHMWLDGDDASFVWSRSEDPAHMPQHYRIPVPRSGGGEVVDFGIKDKQLVVTLTTGAWALIGTDFAISLVNGVDPSSVYFKNLNEFGIQAGFSMVQGNDWVIYLTKEPAIRAVITVVGTSDQLTTVELAPAIRPTLESMTDLANASAVYADGQYWLVFPADAKAIRLFFFENEGAEARGIKTEQAVRVAPTYDTQRPFRRFLRRADGTLLAADATTGQIWKLQDTNSDDGTAIPFEIEWYALDAGDPLLVKDVPLVTLVTKQPQEDSSAVVSISSDMMSTPVTTTLSGLGEGYDLSEYDADRYDRFDVKAHDVTVDGEGRWFTINVSNSSVSEPLTVYGVALKAYYRDESA